MQMWSARTACVSRKGNGVATLNGKLIWGKFQIDVKRLQLILFIQNVCIQFTHESVEVSIHRSVAIGMSYKQYLAIAISAYYNARNVTALCGANGHACLVVSADINACVKMCVAQFAHRAGQPILRPRIDGEEVRLLFC